MGIWRLKWELEDRAFSVLEPDAYNDIKQRVAQKRIEREAYVSEVVQKSLPVYSSISSIPSIPSI